MPNTNPIHGITITDRTLGLTPQHRHHTGTAANTYQKEPLSIHIAEDPIETWNRPHLYH